MVHLNYYSDYPEIGAEILVRMGWDGVVIPETKPEYWKYDFKGQYCGEERTVEAKYDLVSDETKRFAIELGTYRWGRFFPSQYLTADYYLFVNSRTAALVKSEQVAGFFNNPPKGTIRLVPNLIKNIPYFSLVVLVPVEMVMGHAETVMFYPELPQPEYLDFTKEEI